jgi:hypothetical protein
MTKNITLVRRHGGTRSLSIPSSSISPFGVCHHPHEGFQSLVTTRLAPKTVLKVVKLGLSLNFVLCKLTAEKALSAQAENCGRISTFIINSPENGKLLTSGLSHRFSALNQKKYRSESAC